MIIIGINSIETATGRTRSNGIIGNTRIKTIVVRINAIIIRSVIVLLSMVMDETLLTSVEPIPDNINKSCNTLH